MLNTGVVIETDRNTVKESSLGVMTAAAGSRIFALVINGDATAVKDVLARYGASTVVNLQGDLAGSPDLEAEALVAAIKEYQLQNLLGTASAAGKDLFARVAALLDEPLATDVVAVDLAEKRVKKSHFSGKTFATLKVNADTFLCTIRPNSIEPVASPADAALVEFAPANSGAALIRVVEIRQGDSSKLDLTQAPIIISGGRAIGAAENFAMLEACARKLGAAVGASRAAVDSGYAPHGMQVGQTGKTVSPRLYIACGISGAVQHFAGMKTSKIIVAINEDKDAPIFAKCDYGIVGDIFKVVPALTERL
jgi:electron transfer flavoprotein alpha subunit